MRLSTICESKGWLWGVAGRSGHDEVAIGGDRGSIEVHKMRFQNITAIYEVSLLCCAIFFCMVLHVGC